MWSFISVLHGYELEILINKLAIIVDIKDIFITINVVVDYLHTL